MDAIDASKKLMEYTVNITSNRKRYPVKHITLIRRIQNTCMDIYESLMFANRKNVKTEKPQRLELETKAIAACDILSGYAEMSMNSNLIGSDTLEYWQGLINNVKYMTIAWRESDKKR